MAEVLPIIFGVIISVETTIFIFIVKNLGERQSVLEEEMKKLRQETQNNIDSVKFNYTGRFDDLKQSISDKTDQSIASLGDIRTLLAEIKQNQIHQATWLEKLESRFSEHEKDSRK